MQAAAAVEVDERSGDRLDGRYDVGWTGPSASRLEGPVSPADAVNCCDDGHEGDGPDSERAPETAHPSSRYFAW